MSDELRPIDADHFWIGELMVDLVQLRYELESLNARQNADKTWDVHDRNAAFGNIRRMAEYLAKQGQLEPHRIEYIKKNLLRANQLGLHTGYSEERRGDVPQ